MLSLDKQKPKFEEPLELNDSTAKKIFGYNFFIYGYKEGRIFFKKPDPDNADNYAVIYFGVLIFLGLLLGGSFLLRIIVLLVYGVYALNVFKTEKYIVLDYYKNLFYLETHNLFHQKITELFHFSTIQDISTIYEEKMIPTNFGRRGRNNYRKIIIASIVFLLNNKKSYRFISFGNCYFEELEFIASKLAVALKKNYLDNTNRLPLGTVQSGGESRFEALLPGQLPRISFYENVKIDEPFTVNPLLGGLIILIGSILVICFLGKYF